VLFQIGLAFVAIELETIHEYKLPFFYSFGKKGEIWGGC